MLVRIQQLSSGYFFVLQPNGAITIELHTTFFNAQSDFLGSFTYPGQMPLEPNRAAIKNAHLIPTSTGLRTFLVMLWLGEFPWKECKLVFTITDDIIEFNLYMDLALIASKQTALLLSNLYGSAPGVPTLESTQINPPDGLAAYMKSTVAASPGTMPMVFFPYQNDGAYKPVDGDGANTAFIGMWNAATNTPALHNNNGSGLFPSTAVNGWFYKVSAGGNVDFGSGEQVFYGDGDFVMCNGNTWRPTRNPYGYVIDGYTPDLCFPPNPIINRWEMDALGNGYFVVDPSGGPYCQTQSPFFYVSFMIKRIFAYFGINNVVGGVLTQDWFNRLVIWSAVAIDTDGIINDCTYYMPNISVADFLKELRSYGIFVDFDMTRKIGIVDSLINVQNNPDVIDLRIFQVKGYRETAVKTTYYLITQPVDPADGAFASNYVPPVMQVGEYDESVDETDIALSSVATSMTTGSAPTDVVIGNLDQDAILGWGTPIVATWRVPYIKQPVYKNAPFDAICAVTPENTNNFKLRLIYWHGMVGNTAGYPYPYGATDNQDVAETGLSNFNLSMTPGATDFQPIQFYYNFLLNSKPFEQSFLLNKYVMAQMAANKRYIVWDNNLRAAISCILDQAATDLEEMKELAASKITMYPVILPDNATQPNPALIAPPVTPPYDNGLVYVRFSKINPTETVEEHPTEANSFYADLFVEFFSDAAGTVPKNVINLPINIKTVESFYSDTLTTDTTTYTYTANGTSDIIYAGAPTAENFTDGSGWEYVWVYTLLGSAYYTIIT